MKPSKQLVTLLSLILLHSSAWAWGRQGHAVIADIATANLTPNARSQVSTLLKDDLDRNLAPSGRTTLAEISSWPDEIRDMAPKDAYKGWHTRSNPVCSTKPGTCEGGKCVDQNIIEYAKILKDAKQPHRDRNEALKWVVHLVGDLHTPMHSGVHGKDIEVTIEGMTLKKPATLHQAWDGPLSTLAIKRGPLTSQLTDTAPLEPDAPTQWMQETRLVARQHVFDPLPGFSCNDKLAGPIVLDKAYQEQAIPAIREQLVKAGLRLARLLNESLR